MIHSVKRVIVMLVAMNVFGWIAGAVGNALFIAALTATLGFWSVAIVLAGPLIALVVIPIHNYRLARATIQ